MATTWHTSVSVKAIDMNEAQLEAKRKEIFEASKFDPYYQRYGLFSYPGPLNIGCDALASKLLRHRREDGTVELREKNFLTRPMKMGATAEVLFSSPPYQPDSYAPPHPLKDRVRPSSQADTPAGSGPYMPPGAFHEEPVPYDYMPLGPSDIPSHRNPDGGVKTGPKNFMTANLKKGNPRSTPGLTIGPGYAHMPDEYDRREQMLREERARTKAKIMGSGAFKSRSFSGNNFTSPPELYNSEGLGPARPVPSPTSMRHAAPWRPNNPAKTGIYDKSIGRFPDHMPDPGADKPLTSGLDQPWR